MSLAAAAVANANGSQPASNNGNLGLASGGGNLGLAAAVAGNAGGLPINSGGTNSLAAAVAGSGGGFGASAPNSLAAAVATSGGIPAGNNSLASAVAYGGVNAAPNSLAGAVAGQYATRGWDWAQQSLSQPPDWQWVNRDPTIQAARIDRVQLRSIVMAHRPSMVR